jgi:UDP-N-acetylglucosamine:LPS N-acetylglucosamine transferase
MANTLKLFVGASAGGHANELEILLQAVGESWPVKPYAFVTTLQITAQGFARHGKPVHVIGEADRRKPLEALRVLGRSFMLAWREKPDVVITTGSMPLAVFCTWCKLFGARIVWIDSVAQIDHMSMSGSIMRRIADLCLVQWPDLPQRYPGTEYAGELL